MYTSFFGLQEKPFAITPDPRYLYLSERHAEALAHLLYGINEAGGFIQLTGEVGTGKTTVIRSLLEQLPGHAEVALILNPRITPAEFLLTICEELHLQVPAESRASTKTLMDLLGHYLLDAHARGRRVVLIVDEAQNLSFETLEQVRLLTNLETATTKLLQIILIGQEELRALLGQPDLRQLAQRITGRYHLSPLSSAESAGYVKHRMRVAGATAEAFTPGALREIHRLSNGIPRVINVISDRALLGAFTREEHRVDAVVHPRRRRRGLRPPGARTLAEVGHGRRDRRRAGAGRLRRLVVARPARRLATVRHRDCTGAAAAEPAASRDACRCTAVRRPHRFLPRRRSTSGWRGTPTTRRPRRHSAACSRAGTSVTRWSAGAAASRLRRRASSACSRRARGRSCAR